MLSLLLGLFVSSCVFFLPAKKPMSSESHASSAPDQAEHLVLFLPGLGDRPRHIVRSGFIDEMKLAPQFDSIVADAHFGYYRDFHVVERLHEDVIGPIRDRYDELWIVGVSMGGYGATAYAERYPAEVTGIVLIAPYLGQRKIIESVEEAGGLDAWQGDRFRAKSTRSQHGVRIWKWFQQRSEHPDEPIVYLTSGESDAHMRMLELIRPALPPDRVRTVAGGHDWDAWRPLFEGIVRDELSRR
jgi:pimeloyl-ACP methyl ester carboxylesterase